MSNKNSYIERVRKSVKKCQRNRDLSEGKNLFSKNSETIIHSVERRKAKYIFIQYQDVIEN